MIGITVMHIRIVVSCVDHVAVAMESMDTVMDIGSYECGT